MSDYYPRFCASYVYCIQDDSVLLMRRINTGFMDGFYTVPAGHVEPNEFPSQAAVRELEEETSLIVQPEDVTCFHVAFRKKDQSKQDDREYVDFFFVANTWQGEATNTEPHKCDDMQWFPLNNLPQNTIPYLLQAQQHLHDDCVLSEW